MDAGYSNISGYDISQEQVNVAHKLGMKNIYCSDINDFFDKNEKVDVLVGLDIIEHFTKDELMGFLSKAKKCLNPGGKIILRTPNMDAPQTSLYAFGDVSHETFLNKSSALQVLNSIGFLNTRVHGGLIRNQNPLFEIIRRIGWWNYVTLQKLILFCSARTWHNVVFEPNLIVEASI